MERFSNGAEDSLHGITDHGLDSLVCTMAGTARVGVLYRTKGVICSLRFYRDDRLDEELEALDSLDVVEEWMKGREQGQDKDSSYLDYFYRCLDEDVSWYYLYEAGVGWKVGCTLQDLPVRGQLVPLSHWCTWKVLEEI